MMQIDSISVLLGSFELLDPRADDRRGLVRAGRRLRMELRGARAQLWIVEPLDGPVVERTVCDAGLVTCGDGEAVVLRGDENTARTVVDDRVVRATMTER